MVPLAVWKVARPVRVMLFCCAVAPLVVLVGGMVFDGSRYARSGFSADAPPVFLEPAKRRGFLRPTRLSLGLFGAALVAAAAGAGWYGAIKRRLYHRVWKKRFQVCTNCAEDWKNDGSLYCPTCAAAPPRVGLEQAWKEWYESKHDEFEIDWDTETGGNKAGRWMGD